MDLQENLCAAFAKEQRQMISFSDDVKAEDGKVRPCEGRAGWSLEH